MGCALIRRAQRLPVAARGVKDAVGEGDLARLRLDLVLKDLYGAQYAALYGDAQRRRVVQLEARLGRISRLAVRAEPPPRHERAVADGESGQIALRPDGVLGYEQSI